jgi:TolB-like protein
MQRLAIARSGWLPQSVAPNATKLAAQFVVGSSRARGHRVRVTQNTVNVKIQLPAPTSRANPGPITYEERDLDV